MNVDGPTLEQNLELVNCRIVSPYSSGKARGLIVQRASWRTQERATWSDVDCMI